MDRFEYIAKFTQDVFNEHAFQIYENNDIVNKGPTSIRSKVLEQCRMTYDEWGSLFKNNLKFTTILGDKIEFIIYGVETSFALRIIKVNGYENY